MNYGMRKGRMMIIDTEEFRKAILDLKAGLESGMENGRTFTQMGPEYINQCHNLILDAAQSDNWTEIADVIAYFLFASSSKSILLDMLKDVYNTKCVPTINNAVVKVAALEQASTHLSSALNNYETNRARRVAQAKYENDPKQKAKEEVRQWWLRWQHDPKLYKNKTKFAEAMLDKFDGVLTSLKVITDWCRKWEKEKK